MLYIVGATIGRPYGHNVTFTPHEILHIASPSPSFLSVAKNPEGDACSRMTTWGGGRENPSPTEREYYTFVGVDVLGDPRGHNVTFTPERTVGDACPYKYIIPYVVGEAFRLPCEC